MLETLAFLNVILVIIWSLRRMEN